MAAMRPNPSLQVLIVDDDRPLVAALTAELRTGDVVVDVAESDTDALDQITRLPPDLVVLNVRVANSLTLTLLQALRQQSRAVVILLVGRGDEDARVRGLELGADGYISKPVSARELAARVRAILQHHGAPPPAPAPSRLTVGTLSLDPATYTAAVAGEPLALTVTEFRLLRYLMANPGRVATFAELLREVWGYDHEVASDVVRTTVYRLRQKLRDDPADPRFLQTVPGVGFLLRAD